MREISQIIHELETVEERLMNAADRGAAVVAAAQRDWQPTPKPSARRQQVEAVAAVHKQKHRQDHHAPSSSATGANATGKRTKLPPARRCR